MTNEADDYIEQYREEGIAKKWEWFWPEDEPYTAERTRIDSNGLTE